MTVGGYQLLEVTATLIPIAGLVVLAIDRMTSNQSVTSRTIAKVLGLSVPPMLIVFGLRGLLTSPVATGFLGTLVGFVLGVLISPD